jgi:voltage-gated potassium channel
VTDSAGPGSPAAHEASRRFRKVALTLLRALASTIALLVIYYLLPLDRTSIGVTVAILGLGLLALVGLVAFQVRAIIRSSTPGLRGVGALATSAPLFLLLFSATYYVMGSIASDSFTEPLTRTDALYFTVTVFATVGFGDIAAKTEVARALVTGQMVAGIVIVGIGARIIVDAIKRGREQLPTPEGNGEPDQQGLSE